MSANIQQLADAAKIADEAFQAVQKSFRVARERLGYDHPRTLELWYSARAAYVHLREVEAALALAEFDARGEVSDG